MKIAVFHFSLFGINSYVVYDPETKDAAVVDPGMIDAEEEEALHGFIERNGLRVTHVINTHLHIDHAIGDKYVHDLFNAPVFAHREDLFLGKRLRQQAGQFGIAARVEDVSVNSFLHDGEEIRIGNGVLKVIHVPGHSPGGVALYDAEDSFLISGDSLFAGSVGRTDLPGGSMDDLIRAIRTKLLTLPDNTIVYPGHGPATTIGQEKRSNPYLQH